MLPVSAPIQIDNAPGMMIDFVPVYYYLNLEGTGRCRQYF